MKLREEIEAQGTVEAAVVRFGRCRHCGGLVLGFEDDEGNLFAVGHLTKENLEELVGFLQMGPMQ